MSNSEIIIASVSFTGDSYNQVVKRLDTELRGKFSD